MKELYSWQTAMFFIGVDNEKPLDLDNRIFFSYLSLISTQKMQENILLHSGMIVPNILV